MKVLSILQPWASLVILGHKKIETRSWNTKYRGELLIHASAKKIRLQDGMYDLIDYMERIGFMANYSELPYGSIIGKVNLVDVTTTSIINSNTDLDIKTNWKHLTEQELAFGDYSPNHFGWLLKDNVAFDVPYPAKGQLNLWNHPGTFKCKGCGHELLLEMAMRTLDYCHLCDPNISLKELLEP